MEATTIPHNRERVIKACRHAIEWVEFERKESYKREIEKEARARWWRGKLTDEEAGIRIKKRLASGQWYFPDYLSLHGHVLGRAVDLCNACLGTSAEIVNLSVDDATLVNRFMPVSRNEFSITGE